MECQAKMSRQSHDILEDQPMTHSVVKNLFMSRQSFQRAISAHQENIVTTDIEDKNSEDNVATINIMSRQPQISIKGKCIRGVLRQPHNNAKETYEVQQCRDIVTLVATNHPMGLH